MLIHESCLAVGKDLALSRDNGTQRYPMHQECADRTWTVVWGSTRVSLCCPSYGSWLMPTLHTANLYELNTCPRVCEVLCVTFLQMLRDIPYSICDVSSQLCSIQCSVTIRPDCCRNNASALPAISSRHGQ